MKILIIDKVHSCLPEALKSNGWSVTTGIHLSREQVLEEIINYEGLVLRGRLMIDRPILEAAQQLKFIARTGSGLENIDVAFAQTKNIQVFNSPEGNRDAVGEQAIGMLLSLLNNLNRADREVRQGIWQREPNRGTELKGSTVGIIGYGHMGGAFARKLKGFGVRVLAYDKYKTGFGDAYVQEASLDDLRTSADIISLHVPLTNETDGMINSDFLATFRNPIVLINTSRGQVVRTSDLVASMESGIVTGACLDVLEYESKTFEAFGIEGFPPAFEYLMKSDKVVLAPHIAGWTHQSYEKMSRVLVDKINAAFRA